MPGERGFQKRDLVGRKVEKRINGLVDLALGGGDLVGEFAHARGAFDEIVTKNLHGVDLNSESVEITRLSLWLKTARRDHRLQNLEATIRVGDSLIEEGAFTSRPFDWRAAFPLVFEHGGFDIVIGNPPYVRMELIKPIKPYLAEHYAAVADRADLYAYFYERGVGLLRDGGRLGFISSSTFFRTGSGEPLRKLLSERTAIETVVDFGDAQVFEGVTTYPAIVALCKGAESQSELAYLVVKGEPPDDLVRAFKESARTMPRARLGAGSWRFEEDALANLRDKIAHGRKTLGEVYGAAESALSSGERVSHVERLEFPEITVVGIECADAVLKEDRGDVGVRDEVPANR